MRKTILLIAALFILSGCASKDISRDQVEKKLLDINRSDGISRDEATIIAQNFVIEQGGEKYWLLKGPKVINYGDFWLVRFGPKYFFAIEYDKGKPLEILVLKSDGTIPQEDKFKIQ